jgi:hypothetical protein
MKPDSPISRHNFFIQTTDNLFQQEPFAAKLPTPPNIEDIRLRHERQTLRRLSKTGAILFTVRTYMTPLLDLENDVDSVRELSGAIKAMPKEMAIYKGQLLWGEVVEAWCEERLRQAASDHDGLAHVLDIQQVES